MPIKIKVDEDLPRLAVNILRDHSYDAANVIEQGMGGWKDIKLWEAIQTEERFLITADKGFANIQRYPLASTLAYYSYVPIRMVSDQCWDCLNRC
jgi:hypothetical protein